MPSSLGPIRHLGPADLKACLALSADRQWPAEERKWALLLEAAEGFGIDDPDGGLAGAVVLARYGSGLASVGMMLVASRYRRRGLGHRLMTHLGGQAGRATVFLTATSYGRPLYEKLGFRTTGRARPSWGPSGPPERRNRTGPGPPVLRTSARSPRLTARRSGRTGSTCFAGLLGFCDQIRVLVQDGSITGYAGAWPNVDVAVIGR